MLVAISARIYWGKMQTECLIWKRIVLLYDLPAICSLCLFPARAGMKLCEEMIYQLSLSIFITYQLRETSSAIIQQFWEEQLCGSKSNFIWSLCHPVSPTRRKTILCMVSKAYCSFGQGFDKCNQFIVYRAFKVWAAGFLGVPALGCVQPCIFTHREPK